MTFAQATAAGREYGGAPVVIRSAPGPRAWFGQTDAGPKPASPVFRVFLQVGPDAYIPYSLVFCCELLW